MLLMSPVPTGSVLEETTMGMLLVAFLIRQSQSRPVGDNDIYFQTDHLGDEIRVSLRSTLTCPKDDADVFGLDVAQIAQTVYKRWSGSGAGTCQITNPRNFCRLLRLGRCSTNNECAKQRRQAPCQKTILDC